MAQQTNKSKLHDTWRALAGSGHGNGWRTIPIEIRGNCRILAGRLFPADEEAILVGFHSAAVPQDKNLPQGLGFQVSRLERNIIGDGNIWISLARLPAGSLDMFCLMAEDIVSFLSFHHKEEEETILQAFQGRIRAWQNFMDRGNSGVLSSEAEIGLFGELSVLRELLKSNLSALDAVDAWQGPVRETQDFLIGTGGIEVKTTVAQTSFPAKIGSLEQLDSSLIHPLYLAGVRLQISEAGHTLPDLAYEIGQDISADLSAKTLYDNRLIQAGLLEAHAESYIRKFQQVDTLVFHVDDNFPRLTQGNVRVEIRKSSYEIDLALVQYAGIDLTKALKTLRGI